MEEFAGTVRLVNDDVTLQAVLLVADNRLRVSAQEHKIGDWKLTDISTRMLPDGCHLAVEGEELVVSVSEPHRFAEAIGPSMENPGDGSLRSLGDRDRRDKEPRERPEREDTFADRMPPVTPLVLIGIATVGLLALWAPLVLVALVLTGALASLLVGGFALMDPFTAVRLPDRITPSRLFRAGVGGLMIAMLLAVLL